MSAYEEYVTERLKDEIRKTINSGGGTFDLLMEVFIRDKHKDIIELATKEFEDIGVINAIKNATIYFIQNGR